VTRAAGEIAKTYAERFRDLRSMLSPRSTSTREEALRDLNALEQQVRALDRDRTEWMNAVAILGRKLAIPAASGPSGCPVPPLSSAPAGAAGTGGAGRDAP
jgi:hypothetical protein